MISFLLLKSFGSVLSLAETIVVGSAETPSLFVLLSSGYE